MSALVWYPATQGVIEADWFLGAPADPLFRLGRSAENAPPAEGRRPLIVLSHGTGGSAAMLAWLGEALARAGYLVAAVNHHGNTSAEPVPTPEGFMLWWERATDAIAPAASNARRIAGLVPGARFWMVAGAGHYTFLAECQPEGKERKPDLCGDEPGFDRVAVHRKVAADAATFFGNLFGPQ